MRRAQLVMVSCVWLLGACSDGDDAPSIATADAFVAQAHEAACAALFRCTSLPGAELATQRAYLADAPRCTALRAGAPLLGWSALADLAAAAREGKVRYDGVAAARCIARLATTCDVQHRIGELCADVFTGTVATDGACQRHEECANNGWCDRGQATAMNACPGACKPRKRVGEACAVSDECMPSAAGQRAECFPDATGTARCIRTVTGAPGAEGQPCGHIVGSSGSQDIQCASGLACVAAMSSLSGTCVRPAAAGAACGDTVACAEGSACTATTTMRCTALAVRRAAGERCNMAALELCDPYARLVCRSGVCAAIGDGTLNSMCGNMAVPAGSQCNAGLYCASARCVARKADGEACVSDVECRSDACSRETRTCAARTCR